MDYEYKIGTKVFGDWEIVEELGSGAYGTVYEIHKIDYGIRTKSALKVIRVPKSSSDIKAVLSEGMNEQSASSYFQGFVDEIAKEIVVMSDLKSHPNIVRYEDHQVRVHETSIGWDILIRMELLTPLNDYRLEHPMNEADVLRLGKELCSALVYCQKKEMIHRDIKPENIFISETGQFKLGDFGVARTIDKTTGSHSRKGTEKYMAPEVYLRHPYGSSVDIYSLGLVLYSFMNRGRMPFYPQDTAQIRYEDRENALDRRMDGEALPAPVNAGEAFASVILKACAFNPEDRYHTAEEMLQALNKVKITDASGEKRTDSYFHDLEEKTAGNDEEFPEEEKTIGMEEYIPEEEKTVGMEEYIPEEEKTVGMKEYEYVPEKEKTAGREEPVREERKTDKKGNKKMLIGIAAAGAAAVIGIVIFMGQSTGGNNAASGENVQTVRSFLTSEEEELLSWLQEGVDAYNESEVRESQEDTISVCRNGERDSYSSVITMDTNMQVCMEKRYFSDDQNDYDYDYYTKEGEDEYWYTNAYSAESGDYYVEKILLDESAPEYYRYTYEMDINEVRLPFGGLENTDGSRLLDYQVVKESEEDGVIKISITYECLESSEYNREDALDQWDITEEELELVPDGEEVLENYIEQENQSLEKTYTSTRCYWITTEGHQLIQSYIVYDQSQSEELFEASRSMSDVVDYIRYYKDCIEKGASQSTAHIEAERSVEEMNQYESTYEESSVSSESMTYYVTGADCESIVLPDWEKMRTYQEYEEEY